MIFKNILVIAKYIVIARTTSETRRTKQSRSLEYLRTRLLRRSLALRLAMTALFLFLAAAPAFANNLVISNVTLEDRNASANTLVVQFNISWDHSWRKPDGRHDAAWVFVKLYQNSTAPWIHGKLYTAGTNPTGTSPGTNSDLKIVVPSDKIGAFISRTATGNGTFSSQKVQLVVDYGTSGIADTDTITAKVFGMEMTYIPEGPFYLGGETHDLNEATGALYSNLDPFVSVFNSSGTFQWSRRFGGTIVDNGYGVAVDSSNNILVSGYAERNADLNGDGDTADSNETGNTGVYAGQDGFISVFNSAGTFQWSKRLGGTSASADIVKDVVVDSTGNVVLGGTINGKADLNGDGDTADTSENITTSYDPFISVFNSAGTFQWAKRLGAAGIDNGNGVTVIGSNTVVIVGDVGGGSSADFNGDGDTADPGESAGAIYGGTFDGFISVFDSSGTFQWSKRLGGSGLDECLKTARDSADNIIVTGYVTGNADLNGDADTADTNETGNTGVYANEDAFISVFNSAGTFQWSKRLGGTSSDYGQAVRVDSSNNIIVIGYGVGNMDLNGDGDTADTNEAGNTGVYGISDAFVSVFNSAGTFQWSKRLGGTSSSGDIGSGVVTDSNNRIIVAGRVDGSADLNGDGDTADSNETGNTGVYGGTDAFVSVFNSDGTFQWSKRMGGTANNDLGYSVATDASNNIIVSGNVQGNVDLNGDAAITASYAFYKNGYEDTAPQITTTATSISVDTNSSDDIDTSPINVTGLAGINGNTSWPNGYSAFYMMKYEVTQGQYVDFLNTLSRVQQGNRVGATVSGNTIANYYVMSNGTTVNARNGIRAPASGNSTSPTTVVFGNDFNANGTFNETDDGQNIAMNWTNWPDLLAYADWAGLRPMTELEYEKACRGPNAAIYGEKAWGGDVTAQTSTITQATSILNTGRGNETAGNAGPGLSVYNNHASVVGPMRAGFAATNATNRINAGAGYYGNMELSGNASERAVTLGNSTGRAFTGTQGDGTLTSTASYEGNATNNDWPGINATTARGVTTATGGGWRGGSWYDGASNLFMTNRTVATGGAATRDNISGGRCVRTAP